MNHIEKNLGVQSYCFRHFKDNSTVAKKVRGIGLEKIELCGVHADFNEPGKFGDVVSIYADAGVRIVSIGVQTFQGCESEKAWFECAAAAGAKHISAHFGVSTYLNAIPKVRAWCREFGIRVGIHCHGGYMFGGSLDVLDHLIGLGGPEIGVCIDTAWAMQTGPHAGNPVAWATNFGKGVTGVHFKDFVFEPNGQWKDVVVGTGTLDLPAFSKALLKDGFDGMAVIEYEADVENPDAALKACVDSMRAVLAKL
ncbi:MAG: sugar phosphate isomerase/epimerase [Verrucomicrobiota bacterium]